MTKSDCHEIWEMKLQNIEIVRQSMELNRFNPSIITTTITDYLDHKCKAYSRVNQKTRHYPELERTLENNHGDQFPC